MKGTVGKVTKTQATIDYSDGDLLKCVVVRRQDGTLFLNSSTSNISIHDWDAAKFADFRSSYLNRVMSNTLSAVRWQDVDQAVMDQIRVLLMPTIQSQLPNYAHLLTRV